MEIVKKYKTISILVFLIIIFGILSVFVKVFNIGAIKTNSQIQGKTSVITTPSPAVSDPFIHADNFNIPASYMGYSVTKVTNGDLGKAALKFGNKNVDLMGTEWTVKKSKVLDVEYTQIKPMIDSFIQGQLVNKGWKKTLTVGGKGITPNVPTGNDVASGYVQVSDGKFQAAILQGNKDKLGNVEFKLFLSNVTDIKGL